MGMLHAVAVAGPQTVVTTAETIVATLTPVWENQTANSGGDLGGSAPSLGGQGIWLDGNICVSTVGAAATVATVRVRVGSVTGTIVGTLTQNVTAAQAANIPIAGLDPTLIESGTVYVVTIAFTSATGNSTIGQVTASAEAANSNN